jgi:hypothetical protein
MEVIGVPEASASARDICWPVTTPAARSASSSARQAALSTVLYRRPSSLNWPVR